MRGRLIVEVWNRRDFEQKRASYRRERHIITEFREINRNSRKIQPVTIDLRKLQTKLYDRSCDSIKLMGIGCQLAKVIDRKKVKNYRKVWIFFYGNITAELLIFKSNSNNRKMRVIRINRSNVLFKKLFKTQRNVAMVYLQNFLSHR